MKFIGPHAVNCACIMDPSVVELASAQGKVKVLYSDPPWGDGNLKYWVTLKNRQNPESLPQDSKATLSYDQLLSRIDELIRYVDGYVFIETGERWRESLKQHFRDIGLYNVVDFDLEYNHPKTIVNPVIYGGTAPQYSFNFTPTHKKNDHIAVREILQQVVSEGDLVFDPCCGMGFTAQAAKDLKCRFVGNEFNPSRLKKTIARLEK